MAARSYLLDTNIISQLVRQPQGPVAARIAAVGEDRVLTSIVVACELRYGAVKRGSRRLTRQVEAVLGAIAILHWKLDRTATTLLFAWRSRERGRPSGRTTC